MIILIFSFLIFTYPLKDNSWFEKVILEDSVVKFTVGETVTGNTSKATATVLVDDVDVEDDYLLKPLGKSSISFIPVVEGTGNFGRIILGAALIGLSLGTFGITLGSGSVSLSKAGLSFANASIYSKAAFYVGAALVLSGVSGLLTPTPEIPSDEQKPESSAFSSPLNTSFPGVAIPLAYGTIMVGSVVINTNVVIGDLPEVQE